ncbi:MAG TPA: FkbM family methyltransferase, partial [Cellvibrionaceae bacterium]
IDIGANVGVYSLFAATQMNAQGRILALEPYPPIYQRLLFNIQATQQGRNDWPDIRVLPVGVADRVTSFDLHLNPDNLGQNSIVADSESTRSGATISVQCQPLMSILQAQSIERIDVLKIDIEGAEDLALCPFLHEAADSLLPRYLLIEDSANRWQQDLKGAIASRGYKAILQSRMNIIYGLAGR